jgi:ABC-type phosphate transport system substrate-binding protein
MQNMFQLNIRDALLGTCAAAALVLGASNSAQAAVIQINGGGSTLASVIYQSIFTNLTSQLDATVNFNYAAVGSGVGARGVLCNDGSQVPLGGVNPSVVHYGASDNPLTAAQILAWNNNTAQSGCAVQGGGKALGGPLMQIPTIGTPVTIAYNVPNQTANGGMTFTDSMLCGIFSGKITSWTDAALSGIAVKHPPSGPITVVYRSDGSGTSALFTAHLNKVCNSANSAISFTSTQTFAQLFSNAALGNGPIPGSFQGASGSGGVQASIGLNAAENGTVTGTDGAVGYLSPDFTQAATIHNGSSAFAPVGYVVNHNVTTGSPNMLPNFANTVAALNTAPLPSGTALQDGTQYVPTQPDPTAGYSIVGYTTVILPTCYQDNNAVNGIFEFFGLIYGAADYISLIQQQGFVQLPTALVGIISDNILNNNHGFNIDIQDTNICKGAGGSTYVGR